MNIGRCHPKDCADTVNPKDQLDTVNRKDRSNSVNLKDLKRIIKNININNVNRHMTRSNKWDKDNIKVSTVDKP